MNDIATPSDLKRLADKALADPEIRKKAREQFSDMWKAFEEIGTAAVLEDLSTLPPPSGKPN